MFTHYFVLNFNWFELSMSWKNLIMDMEWKGQHLKSYRVVFSEQS